MKRTLRSKGFTLIELLVVIAIIAILAAMLFPVFARARESARKIQCLANVKNIAVAIQLYLADYSDTLPPKEHRQEVLDYFMAGPGGGTWDECELGSLESANPYLKWPVVLDEYVKNRDVWRCPSGRIVQGARFILPGPDWLGHLKATEGLWYLTNDVQFGPCWGSWPVGWGGDVTDSALQGRLATPWLESAPVAQGVFQQGYAYNSDRAQLKMAAVNDAASFVAVADGGVMPEWIHLGLLMAPELCMLACSNWVCSWVDWQNCAEWAADCGLYYFAPADGSFLKSPDLRRPYAHHLGGNNVGFLDGHAAWMNGEAILAAVKAGKLEGVDAFPTSDCGFAQMYPGVPTLY